MGVDPQNIYRPPSIYKAAPYPRAPGQINALGGLGGLAGFIPGSGLGAENGPIVDQPGRIYGAVYSGVPVFEMTARGIAVMRRRSDSFLNATQILKVAG